METATLAVKYVNPPKNGKQYGSIKSANNETWPVKAERIKDFSVGNTYEVSFTKKDGSDFRNIVGVKLKTAEPEQRGEFTQVPPNGKAAPVNGFYRPTAPRDSERMFVCAIAGHWIDTGRVEMTEGGMIELVKSLRKVYASTFGTDDAMG